MTQTVFCAIIGQIPQREGDAFMKYEDIRRQVLTAIRQEGKDTLAKTLGIDGKIQAIMALGIPAFKYPKYTDRKEIVKNYIE